MYHSQERWQFPIGSSIVTVELSLTIRQHVSDAQINRRGRGSHWGKIWEKGVDRRKPNFNMIWERHGVVVLVCRRKRVDIFCRLNTMNERARQTDRQTTER